MDDDLMSEGSVRRSLENLTLEPNEDLHLEYDLLNHILLPRFLPQSKRNNLYELEMDLLLRMVELVEVKDEWIPKATVNMFTNFYNVQADCQPETIFKQINGLKPGDTFAMFVSGQNCMFVIYMPSTDNDQAPDESTTIIVATFAGNLDHKDIYKNIGDAEFNYPVQALNAKYSRLLKSKEFANQLYVLHNELPKPTSQLVSNWLVEILCDDETATSHEFPVVTKKLRDELLGRTIQQAFRRSRIYLCAKALLQHSLTIQLGEDMGKLLYKVVMLQFVTKVCDVFKAPKMVFDFSLMVQAMAKLARRIDKLTQLVSNEFKDKTLDDELTDMWISAKHNAKSTIKELRKRINTQIDKLQSDDEKEAKLSALTGLNFEEDVKQKVPKLRKYLDERMKPSIASENYAKNAPKYARLNFKTHEPLPDAYFVYCNNAIEKNLRLIDFENSVLYDLDLNDKTDATESIRKNAFSYASVAETLYQDDPLAISRMILVRLKQIAILDRVACDQFPLLSKFRSGINPKIINTLLLPQFIDMKIADELEKYFRMRNTSEGPSLIEEKKVTGVSFGSVFAAQNDEMKIIRDRMLHETNEKIEFLREEWIANREKVSTLRNRLGGQTHQNVFSKKECEHERNAVIFEREIPAKIAHLRDVLHNFTEYCSGRPNEKYKMKNEPKTTPKGHSKKFSKKQAYQTPHLWMLISSWSEYNVCLGSTKFVDESLLHVDRPFEQFILENDCDCTFHASEFPMPEPIADDSIKARCTFKVEKGSDYEKLQWMIDGTSHTENEVLAAQSTCPDGLSLAEFKSFGCLRADGHRLQLHKLYGLIETEALSFEQPSVLSLIMQTMWECEKNGESGVARDTHNVLDDNEFSSAMVRLLRKFIKLQQDNWMHPLKLVAASFIVVRVMEINDDETVSDEIVGILDYLRTVAIDWIEKIQKAICDLQNPDQAMEQSLRTKLALVAFAGVATFFVHTSHRFHGKTLQSKQSDGHYSAHRNWLQFIITVNNNILLSQDLKLKTDLNMPMFLRLVLNIGVQLESSMKTLIFNDDVGMAMLITKQWRSANEATFETSYFDGECPQIMCYEVNKKIVKIDIVTGDFLVNDSPVARLPRKICDDPLYARVFQSFSFEIQPEDSNTFCTLHKYKNCVYKFSCMTERVAITERNIDGTEMELLPINVLETEVPHLLVENYSHWWNKNENTVDFRPKFFKDKSFSTEDGVEYRLHLDEDRLEHLRTERNFLDVTSDSYSNIVKQLSRLEHPNYINILLDSSEFATIELGRMNLKFKVNVKNDPSETHDILSNEFSNMRVSLQQKCGTLYGLNHGLLLESANRNGSVLELLLLPHGEIDKRREKNHVTVNIVTNRELHNPPFHVYRIDNTCRQLKAVNNSHSAWIYIAFLHAISSHGEIEPFTGISGTESALQILQSGIVWSSVPHDRESIQQLKDFAQLSPKRKTFGATQTVEWPDFIPPHSAQDSYVFIAKKLLEDSQRLHELHFAKEVTIDLKTDLNLNEREYFRHLDLSPNFRVADIFIQHKSIYSTFPKMTKIQLSTETRTICSLYHKSGFCVAEEFDLWSFLTENTRILIGLAAFDELDNILNHRSTDKLVNLWISLYDAARTKRFNSEEFALIWTLLAHTNKDIEPILALQAIERNAEAFQEPPDVEQYDISEGFYSKDKIIAILRKYASAAFFYSKNDREDLISKLSDAIDQAWPCEEFDDFPYSFYDSFEEINEKLMIWSHNQILKDFVTNVEDKLQALMPAITTIHVPQLIEYKVPVAKEWKKYEFNFDAQMNKIPSKFTNEIEEARVIWNMGPHNSKKTSEQWWQVYESVISNQIDKYFIDARMQPRLVPSLVLPKITSENIDERLKVIIGALAITIAKEQREYRIKALQNQEQLQPDLQSELDNQPFVNWSPKDYPEWLIFEIEQNLTIRRIQIEIAKRMIHPPELQSSKHSTMQLNMGEGKTAVIVPILASVLADGQQVCQITVLKSLFATNVKSIRKYLGGMLNRRIYIFPCRRDMPIAGHLDKMLNIYEECKKMKGVIMSLPEYQLSFQLKMYESIQKKELENGKALLSVQNWLNSNIRGILDESDAILQPKYQLIYTVGNQFPLDGGTQRWIVMQALLKRVPHHMELLRKKYGNDCIEFDNQSSRPTVFIPCRILKESMYSELKKAIIEDLFSDQLEITLPEMGPGTRIRIEAFLNQKDDVTFDTISNELTKKVQNDILLINGVLHYDVLKLMLVKRWRVNYGINPKGKRKMAVPFRAKDVAAEMTEFGHPDVAIGFTQLSYYYSGLSDAQLHTVFKMLTATQNASETYEYWIRTIPSENVDTSIKSYSGVNLSDPHQRDHLLFPLFRCNMYVIDFWLSKVVFPHEAKTFQDKLMCTAWDLCSERIEHLVTGFSGTNDTMNILPTPIAQNDLEELESTNENVRKILLQSENRHYEKLPANVSAENIIKKLLLRDIQVLLDAGALMLEYNNKQVAEQWLKMTPVDRFDAAVYFDTQDILQTTDRNGTMAEFDCSVYRENLGRCLVYLDDTHTRGTDMKFPLGRKACVTLSGEIQRDKTMQACMRMRKLGHGHSIEFWASFEADLRIRETCNLKPECLISSKQVIKFICENSRKFEIENTVHWVTAAHNYTKKLAAHKLYESSLLLDDLYNGCVDSEFVTLREMYSDKDEKLLSEITLAKLKKLFGFYEEHKCIQDLIQNNYMGVQIKLKGPAADIRRFVYTLDEEQEKEIEYEPEAQWQVERPLAVKAVVPSFNANLETLILCGLNAETLPLIRPHLFPLGKALQDTKLGKEHKNDPLVWSSHICVTNAFMNVIETTPQGNDDFLRPVWWIARVDAANDDYILILLSSYECDRLLPAFRNSSKATLYMFRPRISKAQSDLLDVEELRITGKNTTADIDVNEAAQIKVYSGSMYFRSDAEQNAYCNFLGLIPRPRNKNQEMAFTQGLIKANGFVPIEHRNSELVAQYVCRCKFVRNPVDLAIRLIEAHHQFNRKESHAAMILERGLKVNVSTN